MAATRYRRFLKLCEAWPVDDTKVGRDLGAHIRERVAKAFQRGDASVIDEKKCDEMYESLYRISSNQHLKKYQRSHNENCSGLEADQLRLLLATESLQELEQYNMTFTQRLREKFFKNKEEPDDK